MPNQKNEWSFQDNAIKKEFGILYDALKCAKLPLLTEHNAVYGLEDAVLVMLYMYKNGATANRAVTELGITFRDDRSVSIPTAQWLLGMIGAMDPDKMDVLCRRMLKSTIKNGSGLERKTDHMLAIDKHLIPFTGADRYNDNFVISGRPKDLIAVVALSKQHEGLIKRLVPYGLRIKFIKNLAVMHMDWEGQSYFNDCVRRRGKKSSSDAFADYVIKIAKRDLRKKAGIKPRSDK